jgi:hypothetical protein
MFNKDEFLAAVERARQMTPDERIREGFRLFEQGRDYIAWSIESTFPEMTPDDVHRIRDRVIRQCKMWGIL